MYVLTYLLDYKESVNLVFQEIFNNKKYEHS